MAKITWKGRARRQAKRLDRTAVVEVVAAIETLSQWPECSNVKPLRRHKYDYRLRVGRYRVLFDVETGDPVIIQIQEVKKRDERTY